VEEAAALSDVVLVLNKGRVVDFAPPDRLVEKVPGRYVVEVYGADGRLADSKAVVEIGDRRLYYVEKPPEALSLDGAKVVVRPKSLEDYVLLTVGAIEEGYEDD
jgi:ABC-2 type transport system ATP-binding protein